MTRENNKEVIWVCERCGVFQPDSYTSYQFGHAVPYLDSDGDMHPEQCGPCQPYIPLSQYEALKDKLALAVEALENIRDMPQNNTGYSYNLKAREALEAVEHE